MTVDYKKKQDDSSLNRESAGPVARSQKRDEAEGEQAHEEQGEDAKGAMAGKPKGSPNTNKDLIDAGTAIAGASDAEDGMSPQGKEGGDPQKPKSKL